MFEGFWEINNLILWNPSVVCVSWDKWSVNEHINILEIVLVTQLFYIIWDIQQNIYSLLAATSPENFFYVLSQQCTQHQLKLIELTSWLKIVCATHHSFIQFMFLGSFNKNWQYLSLLWYALSSSITDIYHIKSDQEKRWRYLAVGLLRLIPAVSPHNPLTTDD